MSLYLQRRWTGLIMKDSRLMPGLELLAFLRIYLKAELFSVNSFMILSALG